MMLYSIYYKAIDFVASNITPFLSIFFQFFHCLWLLSVLLQITSTTSIMHCKASSICSCLIIILLHTHALLSPSPPSLPLSLFISSCRAFDIPFYIGTVAPFILIYIFNFIVFTIIIISLLKRGQSSATKLPGHIYVKQQLGVAISLSVLFGISWGIGLFASRRIYSGSDRIARDVIAAIFIILTAFHGLILFLMHCVRPAKVREEVRSVFFDRSKKTRTTSGAIQKDKLTKHAAYTTTFDKRGSYDTAMFPPQRSSGSLSSIKKNDDSMMMSNYYTIREEETGFASNPDFVNGESPDHKGINGDSQAGKVNLSCSNDSHEVHVPLNDDQPMLDNCSPVQA